MSKTIIRNWLPVVLAAIVIPLCLAIAAAYSGTTNANANPHATSRANAAGTPEHQPQAHDTHLNSAEFNVITANQLETRQLFVLGSVLLAIATAARLLHKRLLDTRGQHIPRRPQPVGVNSLNALRPKRG